MALSNYIDLAASILSWTHRTDLTVMVPDWVRLCETTINYGFVDDRGNIVDGLRTGSQETIGTGATVTNLQTVVLPTNFLQMRRVFLTFSGVQFELKQRPISPMGGLETSQVATRPETYWISAGAMYLNCLADQIYPVTFDYYASVGPLETQNTNWLMTAAPSVYLGGTVLHGAPWFGPTFNPAPWSKMFSNGMAQVRRADARKRYANSMLRTEAAKIGNGGYTYAQFLSGA